MIILSSPEYEGRLEYQYIPLHDDRLDTPSGIYYVGSVIYFNAVNNAESYSIYFDGQEFDEVALIGSGEISIDLSLLSNWSDLMDGSHALQLVARASNKKSSFLSQKINYIKSTDFVKGVIYGPYAVTKVVDGDTIDIMVGDIQQKLRMIGVNTPESVATGSAAAKNCQEGRDASDYTKSQLTNHNVYIEFDTDQFDKFNRFLCYVYLDSQGNQMYNGQLISQGYGEAKYYSPNGAHRTYLEGLQATAKANNVGFWGTGFFPTKLEPPVVTLSGDTITWPLNAYTASYNIKDNGTIIYTYEQPVDAQQNSLDLTTLQLSSGNHRINVVSVPTNPTHEMSNNSNNITYTVV